MHSSTTSSGSSNSFTGANASIGGQSGINADALSSSGDISDDGNCQTAHGHSRVAGAGLGAPSGDTLNVAEGDSSSTACNDGTKSTNQSSSVIELAGTGVPIPATGCENGTANTNFVGLAPLLSTVCNADDTNGSQTSSPYGVREALTVFALALNGSALLKTTTAGPESHAVAPGTGPATPPKKNTGGNKGAGGKGGNNGGNGGGNGGGAGNGSAAGSAGTGNGALAFTGADLLALALVGGALILGGLALTTTAGRRHRQTV
jgi:5'-nucleotidase